MTEDQRLADLLTECLAELGQRDEAAAARAKDCLRQIEAAAPGALQRIRAAAALRRSRWPTRTVQ